MASPQNVKIVQTDIDKIAGYQGRVAIVMFKDGKRDKIARRINKLTRGALDRLEAEKALEERKAGEIISINYPLGLEANAVDVVVLERKSSRKILRAAGAALAQRAQKSESIVLLGALKGAQDVILGALLRRYVFDRHATAEGPQSYQSAITFSHNVPETIEGDLTTLEAISEGVHFTRDLVNEPANILTTREFAERLSDLSSLGLEVSVLEEEELEKLGMGALLCVGQGSDSPSKVVVMEWKGAGDESAPLAFVGKGVVFDTGGISLKPAAGMHEMVMDMGGAGVVAGVMKTLALRKAKANVVGLVGLVENMPSGSATRPGDVVTSMKGDTIEVLNTDAEGRLVLADVMWYAQDRFKPRAMIDLATLTGAIIVSLGSENAGQFSNDDSFSKALSAAADQEGEGLWRLPLSDDYDKLIKSKVADIANMGSAGREAGSIVAAQFLQRFVKDDTPWVHIDIAGVAYSKKERPLSPSGATGWGVMTLDRLVSDMLEQG